MLDQAGQASFASPSCDIGSAPSRPAPGFRSALPAETLAVTGVVVLAIMLMQRLGSGQGVWLIGPCALLAGALLPTMVRNGEFPRILPERSRVSSTCLTLLAASGATLAALFGALWVMKALALPIPLQPRLGDHSWPAWLTYQLLYVAVAEECFFRGYVQSNISNWVQSVASRRHGVANLITIVLSAAVFAAAHVVVQGQIVSAVTFLPGLVLAWLFASTRSLAAPIVFHALANTTYHLSALALA